MQCKNCGNMMQENDVFCRNCGAQQSINQNLNEQPKVVIGNGIEEKHSAFPIILAVIVGIIFIVLIVVALGFLGFVTTNKVSDKSIERIDSIDNKEKIIGDDNYGYVSVPYNWYKFYDVDGNDSIQYSYANQYIISLNLAKGNCDGAKQCASNYMYNKKNSGNVTDVTGATVKIGKNNEYTAYQVYMYYPSDSTYLITYWFEAEDGRVHYMALEGPKENITNYLSIPSSFSLKNVN